MQSFWNKEKRRKQQGNYLPACFIKLFSDPLKPSNQLCGKNNLFLQWSRAASDLFLQWSRAARSLSGGNIYSNRQITFPILGTRQTGHCTSAPRYKTDKTLKWPSKSSTIEKTHACTILSCTASPPTCCCSYGTSHMLTEHKYTEQTCRCGFSHTLSHPLGSTADF